MIVNEDLMYEIIFVAAIVVIALVIYFQLRINHINSRTKQLLILRNVKYYKKEEFEVIKDYSTFYGDTVRYMKLKSDTIHENYIVVGNQILKRVSDNGYDVSESIYVTKEDLYDATN